MSLLSIERAVSCQTGISHGIFTWGSQIWALGHLPDGIFNLFSSICSTYLLHWNAMRIKWVLVLKPL